MSSGACSVSACDSTVKVTSLARARASPLTQAIA
jgi:hypothetical protein